MRTRTARRLSGIGILQAKSAWSHFGLQLRAAWWLIAYLLVITALSWAASKEFEGHDYIGYGWDQLCVAIELVVIDAGRIYVAVIEGGTARTSFG